MTNRTKEPSSSPTALNEGNQGAQVAKTQKKGARQEPKSDPTGTSFHPTELDSLNEEQLRKLTKANTKRNHGGRSSRLRSQVERVFRRLDNLAADVKLQPRYSMDALPVVSPDNPSTVPQTLSTHAATSDDDVRNGVDQRGIVTDSECKKRCTNHPAAKSPTATVLSGAEQKLDPITLDQEEFEIEPATNNSSFTYYSSSLGTQSGSGRSVRISTSVTVLDYKPSQPVSVARLQRFEHPTRTGKCLQTRKILAEEVNFPRAMQRLDEIREGENRAKERDTERRKSTQQNMSQRVKTVSPPSPRRVRSAGSTPTAYIVPNPTGPYGSRTNLN